MSYVSTEEETGIFSAAFRIVEVVGVLPWMLVRPASRSWRAPRATTRQRLGYALQQIFEVAAVLGVFIAMGLAIAHRSRSRSSPAPTSTRRCPVLRIQAAGCSRAS